jgi:hypothetical protein
MQTRDVTTRSRAKREEAPPVAIRCPECGALLREVAHATGAFTVVACGPCGVSFRLAPTAGSGQWDEATSVDDLLEAEWPVRSIRPR